MKAKSYKPIGTSYIIGRVYRHVKKGKNATLFQIQPDPTDVIDISADNSDLEEEEIEAFDPGSVLPSSLAEVEAI
eukprot:jgi/Phyca11/562673/estExt2_Genewise1.C_PHYCAscaffold_100063